MKGIISAALAVSLFLAPAVMPEDVHKPEPETVTWTENVNYMELMETVLEECGDDGIPAVRVLEEKRNQKISDTGAAMDCTSWCDTEDTADGILKQINAYKLRRSRNYTEDDVELLAHVIFMEAGADWLSDEWKMCVGEVVMNRLLSDEWPNTLSGVVYQKGQYDRTWLYDTQTPTDRCYEAARRVLDGERLMQPDVVFQAGFKQGSKVYKTFYDSYFGYTYFCIA